jgi:hypothetical protein
MKTVFTAFPTYQKAKDVVDLLLQEGMNETEINAIVAVKVVKGSADINWETIHTELSGKLASRRAVHGLDAIIGREVQGINLSDTGEVYAAGELATLLARAAADKYKQSGGSLRNILLESGLPPQTAAAYLHAVEHEGVLLIIRTDDIHATIPFNMFVNHQGINVASV